MSQNAGIILGMKNFTNGAAYLLPQQFVAECGNQLHDWMEQVRPEGII